MLTIHRRNPAWNEARFYAVARQADLLAGWTVAREWGWGRIGCAGRVMVDLCSELHQAKAAAHRLAERKARRRYRAASGWNLRS